MEQNNSSTSNSRQALPRQAFYRFLQRFLLPFLAITSVSGLFAHWAFERYIVLGKATANGAYKVHRILTETHPDEIPIFGSSRANGSFIANILGKKYHNYGLDGAFDNVSLFFLKEELKKNKKTPIIIELGMEGLNPSTGNAMYYLPHASNPSVKALMGDFYKPWHLIPLVKYYGYTEAYTDIYLKSLPTTTQTTLAWSKQEAPIEEFIRARLKMPTVFRNDSGLVKALDTILRAHTTRKIIFVIPPYHSAYFTTFEGEKEAQAYLVFLTTFSHVRVLDCGHFSYPNSLFINTTHLNYEGAVRFSTELRFLLNDPS